MISKQATIKKLPSGKYRVYSEKKGPDGERKNLGTYNTRAEAKKRLQQIHFFEHQADDNMTLQLCDIADYLENAGLKEEAGKIDDVMYAVDYDYYDDQHRFIENPGDDPTGFGAGGSYALLSVPEGQPADDGFFKDLYERSKAREDKLMAYISQLQKKILDLESILEHVGRMYDIPLQKYYKEHVSQDNADMLANSNGLGESSVLENGGANVNFMSDTYLHRKPGIE